MINILHSDTVGLATKQWSSVPMEIYNETEVFNSNPVEKEVVIQTQEVVAENIITSDLVENEMIIASNAIAVEEPTVVVDKTEFGEKAEIVESSLNLKLQSEKILQFFNPLWLFVQENKLLAGLFLAVLGLIFYLLFRKQSSSSYVDMYDFDEFDDEFEIPHDIKPRKNSNNSRTPDNPSIITQGQYSILYGLINETFIHEKESIMLSPDITQERKDRALISLERKFNKILHFSLPKLSSNNSSHFTEGVHELLNENFTKDILVVALKDILNINSIEEDDKKEILKKLKSLETKKEFA